MWRLHWAKGPIRSKYGERSGWLRKWTVKVVKTSPGLKTASTNVMRAAVNTHSGSSGVLLACWFNTFTVRTDATGPFSKQQVHQNTNPDSSLHVYASICALPHMLRMFPCPGTPDSNVQDIIKPGAFSSCVNKCFTLTARFLPPRPATVTIQATWCLHFLSFLLLFRARKESWDMWRCVFQKGHICGLHLEEPLSWDSLHAALWRVCGL